MHAMAKRSGRVGTVIAFGTPGDVSLLRRRRIPNLTRRWSRWRGERANLRRLPAQTAATETIRPWLEHLLGPSASIESFELNPRDATLKVVAELRGRRTFTFVSVDAWLNVEPRDNLAASVLEHLDSEGDADAEFFLSGYAEESYTMSDRWRDDENQ